MTVIERDITLNLDRLGRTRQMVRFTGKVGDHQSRRIVAHILNGAAPFTLDGSETAFLNCARKNPTTGAQETASFEATITQGAVCVTLPLWVFTYPGLVLCEIAIASGTATVRTEDFYIQSMEAVRDTVIGPQPEEDIQTLTELIAEARAVLDEIDQQGLSFDIDNTLKYDAQNRLGVNTTSEASQDNTLPITAAGVYTQIGNINALLNTI